ncbi:MAG: ABC transporter permease [Bacteroidales bacterium]|jgi:putative ABC transport system permease protein|nr:ABC transporter permease [Bacteroidales bacterium]
MFDIDKYKEIWQTITRNKMRSFITGFGVAWGIFLFVVMFGIGNGFQNGILNAFGESITNAVIIFPSRTTIEYKGFNPNRSWNIYNEDLNIIKQTLPEVKYISGMVHGGTGKIMREDRTKSYMIKAVDVDYFNIDVMPILYGRIFNRVDMEEKRKICVIGKRVWEEMFDKDENPMGKQLTLNGIAYNVVGVVEAASSEVNFMGNSSEAVFVPLTTMQQINNTGLVIHMLTAIIAPTADINQAETKIKDLLKLNHNIAPEDDDAMIAFNLHDSFLMFNNLFLGIKILVWIVGMGTLLAGVVGISNIMLISIRERTNEIGVRRALGAKPNVILRQIMGEGILLTFIAGYIGFLLGVIILSGVNKVIQAQTGELTLEMDMQISFGMSMLAMAILLAAGVIAGIIPAKNALKIKVIDAIRDE